MLRTKYRCVQSPNISVDVAKCGEIFHKFTRCAHFLSVTKIDLSWVNNPFIVMFQLHSMSSYAKSKLQLCSVSQRQCRRRQMWGKFHKFCQYTHFLSVTKSDLSWLNNLFMVNFQLIRMSSSAKNKNRCVQPSNISVEVAKCGKIFTNSPSTLTFIFYKKNDFLTEQSIHSNVSTH